MYTILVGEDNQLITSVRERVVQRSKLVDSLHFLVDPTYKGIDMSDWVVCLEYILPISREYKTEILAKSDQLYKNRIEYKVGFDTNLTQEPGNVELQLTFIKVEMDADGQVVQRVRKTTPTTITIVPVSAWSNAMPDSSLAAIDQRLVMAEMLIGAANDTLAAIDSNKADNMMYNQSTNTLQLTANGSPIGDKIVLNKDKCINRVQVDENGNLVVIYSDNTIENIGKISGNTISGIYIPDVSRDGILTMTLSKDVGEHSYSWDINPNNDWNPIDGEAETSSYLWEEL